MKNQTVEYSPAGDRIRKRNVLLKVAGFAMMLIGIMEMINGIQIFQYGRSFFYVEPVLGDVDEINSAVTGIFTVSGLLFFCGLGIILNREFFWRLSFFSLILYCAVEIINGSLLFKEILESQFVIPVTASIFIAMLLFIGKRELD